MILPLVLIALISACSDGSSGGRQGLGGTQKQKKLSPPPIFANDLNVLQNGKEKSSSTFSLPVSSQEGFLFWGEQIDTYIRHHAPGVVHCLLLHYPSPAQKEYLLMAARPLSNGDTLNPQKYYYQINPQDGASNKRFCDTSEMTSRTGVPFGGAAFTLEELCPHCKLSSLESNSLKLLSISGQEVPSVKTHYLKISVQFQDTNGLSNTSCTSSSTCRSKGFDCCSSGQCVKDGQIKRGIDRQSNEFVQAESEILNNPKKISDYPHFYHLCSQQISSPAPQPSPNPIVKTPAQHFDTMQELYQCTTPIEGEKGLCTITLKDIEGSGTYRVPGDDRDFSYSYTNTKTPLRKRTIDRITYAGDTLYENGDIRNPNSLQFGQSNDSLIDGQSINLSHTPRANVNRILKMRYQIDASCEYLGYDLARCYKIYIQGQSKARIDDHYPASNDFILPFYADTNRNIQVKVDDITKLTGTHWRVETSPYPKIVFLPDRSDLFVKDNQTVKIIFFVDLNQYPVMSSKLTALRTIKDMCQCQDFRCRLKEQKKNGVVNKYVCHYPTNNTPVPLQQTISLSTKTVPHRYFDRQGNYIAHSFDKKGNYKVPQAAPQEGIPFEYINKNLLKPNNLNKQVGFNEIYGTLGTSISHAFPASEIAIKKGKDYNIYVDSGHFSTCLKCGNDYYSYVKKLFPQNFLQAGGGYYPDHVTTNRFSTKTFYRADDLLFGRACWLPATMIPWTHSPLQNSQKQRLRRLESQHFLFANGYQRDWYGFDYGSVIGSFDGVTWFAIGNQRKIHAEGSKLFLAVNAYFGDLTQPNNFRVVISESQFIQGGDSLVTKSIESDGAECRKYHRCNTDKDCVAQLGWEYSCEIVTGMETRWPRFDDNALEIPDDTRSYNLLQLFDDNGGGSKRCVYRGRGAPCHPNYQIASRNSSFSGTEEEGIHACSYNTHCKSFSNGTLEKKFNTRISRYAHPPATLNASSEVDFSGLNTFGLDAKLIGRPERWIGRNEVPSDIFSALNQNNIHALCLPGRDPTDPARSVLEHNSAEPIFSSLGDKVLNIGVTPTGPAGLDQYLSGCSIHDQRGNYYQEDDDHLTESLSNADLARLAGHQAVPSNALEQLEELIDEELITNFEQIQIENPILQDNRCLRAPGSVCFSDLDCAPSAFITRRTRAIDPDDSNLWSVLNPYEIRFWQEELVCSQAMVPESKDYDLKNNRCCRETGKTLTIGTRIDQSHHSTLDSDIPVFNNRQIPGLGGATGGIDLNDPARYTRNSTIFDLSTDDDYPPLQSARRDACGEVGGCFVNGSPDFAWNKQFNTFAITAERTCCNGHWVRHFHDSNGGGHTWKPSKFQTIPKESFTCLNWLPCSIAGGTCGDTPFTCTTEQPDDPQCSAKSTTTAEARPVFEFLGTLELLGIPQIKVKNEQWAEVNCVVDPNDQELYGTLIPLPNLIAPLALEEYVEPLGRRFLAADDPDNFSDNLKQVFSPDKVSCCIPAGTRVEKGTDPDRCCTGFINGETERCQLPDFTNLSVYFNRYVSSHAKNIDSKLFDEETGYISSPVNVETLACKTRVCASGAIARGIVLSELFIPGHEKSTHKIRRWLDGNSPRRPRAGHSLQLRPALE